MTTWTTTSLTSSEWPLATRLVGERTVTTVFRLSTRPVSSLGFVSSVHFYTARTACGRVYVTVRCPSVCPIYRLLQAGHCGGFSTVGPVGRRYRSIAAAAGLRSSTAHSSKCEQCHAVSWRRKLNADLLNLACHVVSVTLVQNSKIVYKNCSLLLLLLFFKPTSKIIIIIIALADDNDYFNYRKYFVT